VTNRPQTAKINKDGVLEIGGCDVASLAGRFGTPLYVMDEKTLRERCRSFVSAFKSGYDDSLVVYASKALCTAAVMKIVSDEGLGVDVVSGGELYTALKAGCDPKKIYFHGNNKSGAEIGEALEAGVGRFVADSFEELRVIDELSSSSGSRADVMLRINPGVEAHTHEFIQTGKTDSKFGIDRSKAEEAVDLISKMKNVNFIGLHAHIGSQIFDPRSFTAELDVLLGIAAKVSSEEINIGGGLGIDYLEEEGAPTIESFAETITSHFRKHGKGMKLVLEPGRSIVGPAGVTLYRVGVIKDIPGVRKYVSVDGGMADNPRPILYQARYDAVIGNRAGDKRTEKVTIAGRYCESGDVLIKDIMIQPPSVGDTVAVMCTGAYNYSMASNYNRVPRPAMVLVSDGDAVEIVGRETYEDITAKDVVF